MKEVSFAKRYGQVFLKDKNIARFEVSLLDLPEDSMVLEIGPGEGILTGFLLQSGYLVTCVESDHRFYDLLTESFAPQISSDQLKIEKMDFLKFSPGKFDGIIGNIPYHISSSIIFRLQNFYFKNAVLMVQKEFADRLIASPGKSDYSRLSVNAQLRYEIDVVRKVPREKFSPRPNVDSTIITLKLRNSYEEYDLHKVDELLKIIFSQRRKKLGTIIKKIPDKYKENRPGELTPEDYVELTSCL